MSKPLGRGKGPFAGTRNCRSAGEPFGGTGVELEAKKMVVRWVGTRESKWQKARGENYVKKGKRQPLTGRTGGPRGERPRSLARRAEKKGVRARRKRGARYSRNEKEESTRTQNHLPKRPAAGTKPRLRTGVAKGLSIAEEGVGHSRGGPSEKKTQGGKGAKRGRREFTHLDLAQSNSKSESPRPA